MIWFIQTVGAVLIAILLSSVIGYTLYKFRERKKVSVVIVAEAWAPISEIAVVVSNHGRAPVVITELSVHIPVEEIAPKLSPARPPVIENPHFHKCRRLFRTFDSKNDLHGFAAKRILAAGAMTCQVMPASETATVMPKEKIARQFARADSRLWYFRLETPTSLTLVPSSRTFGDRAEVWGPPTIVGIGEIDGQAVTTWVVSLPSEHHS